jgi:hypothetical protein
MPCFAVLIERNEAEGVRGSIIWRSGTAETGFTIESVRRPQGCYAATPLSDGPVSHIWDGHG